MNAEQKASTIRLERIRRQVMSGTYSTPDKLDRTAEWVRGVLEGRDRLYSFVGQGIKDQRAIDELAGAFHG